MTGLTETFFLLPCCRLDTSTNSQSVLQRRNKIGVGSHSYCYVVFAIDGTNCDIKCHHHIYALFPPNVNNIAGTICFTVVLQRLSKQF